METEALTGTERIRRIALELIEKADDPEAIDRAVQLIKSAGEAENQEAQAAKYAAEEKKITDDLSDDAKNRQDREERRAYITSLSPMVATMLSTLALAGTLFLQFSQFKSQREAAQAQRDSAAKSLELQTQAALDDRWNKAISVLAKDPRLSPAKALLATFNGTSYEKQAYGMTTDLLAASKSQEDFASTFDSIFSSVNWDNMSRILEIDRHLEQERLELTEALKTETKEKIQMNKKLDLIVQELYFISSTAAPTLRSVRPKTFDLDLHVVFVGYSDLHGADLSRSNLNSAEMSYVDLRGADLSGVTVCANRTFDHTAWWEAKVISPELLGALQTDDDSKYRQPPYTYGPTQRTIPPTEYAMELRRLKSASSIR